MLNPLRLATFLAETFGMPLMDLASLDFSTLPLDQIDRKLLAETRVIPLIKRGNRLAVLLSDPTDNQAIERVKFQQQAIIDPIVVEHSKLKSPLSPMAPWHWKTTPTWTTRRSCASCRRC